IYTIEFQKRGLPHAHIVLFLDKEAKIKSPTDIDKLISAELPDPSTDPELYRLVNELMMHGPCGSSNPTNPCHEEWQAWKILSIKYSESTYIDSDGFLVYKRSNTRVEVKKHGTNLDSRHGVPYNHDLLLRYCAHINVEACNQARPVKYLFKYINKGRNRISDEIKRYYDCRSLSPCEAAWRLLAFDIHFRKPVVMRLIFHLSNEHNDGDHIDDVVNRDDIDDSMFLAWMESNALHVEGRNLTYVQYLRKFVWSKKENKRKNVKRTVKQLVASITSVFGELYYLRILLNDVKGVTSFEDLRTCDGMLFPTYKDASYYFGLIDYEKEYVVAIIELSFGDQCII
ncbi:LOW QUALITY PROTEIN: hypothetical protein V2J09_013995, partial [Rumex salicifolius]